MGRRPMGDDPGEGGEGHLDHGDLRGHERSDPHMRHEREKKEQGREQDDSSPDSQKSRQEARHAPQQKIDAFESGAVHCPISFTQRKRSPGLVLKNRLLTDACRSRRLGASGVDRQGSQREPRDCWDFSEGSQGPRRTQDRPQPKERDRPRRSGHQKVLGRIH